MRTGGGSTTTTPPPFSWPRRGMGATTQPDSPVPSSSIATASVRRIGNFVWIVVMVVTARSGAGVVKQT
ncbi:MAG: hypothetical protein RL260_1407 [Pseudomonadota bacterium]|jgi:hypothetical protein